MKSLFLVMISILMVTLLFPGTKAVADDGGLCHEIPASTSICGG